eukprot:10962925-Alexandrium_andersonii.AAC.1
MRDVRWCALPPLACFCTTSSLRLSSKQPRGSSDPAPRTEHPVAALQIQNDSGFVAAASGQSLQCLRAAKPFAQGLRIRDVSRNSADLGRAAHS